MVPQVGLVMRVFSVGDSILPRTLLGTDVPIIPFRLLPVLLHGWDYAGCRDGVFDVGELCGDVGCMAEILSKELVRETLQMGRI